ncbi:hypothetical protein CXB51_010707 [Gossypium anomalum]|uniref:Reverse transcriptase zinc-binding domain-containing protein n=1 Tax=Gossypium anomalum TaxID=47600 RepID=A0A8J5Z1W4_9ROSI|nr:hypothetical protein CXB51_010707 [Gossypium anomalum]
MSNEFNEVNWAEFFSRPLLDREIIMISCLKEAVSCKVLHPEEEDRLIWIHDNKGVFSVRKLIELLISVDVVDSRFAFDKIWNLNVPPIVKSFLWLVSFDRIPTKEFLSRRGVRFCQERNGCPWCYRELETLTVWLARNELVFERRWPKMSTLVFLSKIRALMWDRSLSDELKVDERIWWVCPIKSWSDVKKSRLSGRFWCPLCFGWVKFNMCGLEIEGEVWCGGVLRNSKGVARAVFSGPCAAKDSYAAEVGAISLALDVFLEMGWKGRCSLIIKVGSTEVFSWVVNKGSRLWSLFSFFKEVDFRLSSIGNVSFSRVDKHGNAMTFALAVAGLKRQVMERDLENLKIDDDEEGWINDRDGIPQQSAYDLCLVGCYLTVSVVHFPALRTTMANLWHPYLT